jgi:hypothetical protein
MKKKILVALVMALAAAAPARAQVQAGHITGTVLDQQRAVLPGATVTLTSADRTLTFTTDADGRYRFLNQPPGTYTLTVVLPGFTTLVRENVVVAVGQSVELPLELRIAAVAETITVTGESPIIDARATGTGTNFTQDELSLIPTSRDPWALLRTVPGVLVDRVNIAGNETGQQSLFASKGTRRQDAVWTMDGIVITDMAAVGAAPTYFNYDAFDEIQVSTAGQDIRQPTGGVGLNFVVKRGTNQFRGTGFGYFTNDDLESSNVPDELRARGVTPATADHNRQISEYGFELGGPIVRDHAWFWVSYAEQDIRLNRQAGNLIDRTDLKNFQVKGNWQATQKDMVNVMWFIGAKEKFGRGTGQAQVEAPTATWNQGNLYPDNRPRGLLKFENNRIVTSNFFVNGRYAYYGTGFSLEPVGGLDGQASISTRLGETFGTTQALRFLRPQHTAAVDSNLFQTFWGGSHDFKFGGGYRRHDAFSQTLWPGNMLVARDFSATDQRARIFREGAGTNRTEYFHLYVGDTFARGPLTLDVGVRWDRQWGSTLQSRTSGNPVFPDLVPGIEFEGGRSPFTWNNVLPRAGATYALGTARPTQLRASYTRFASQLDSGTVGFNNLSANAGFVDFPWVDLNGDRFVQPNEILFDQGIIAFGGGFNPADPRSGISANQIDPNLRAPVTDNVVAGIDRELMPNLAVQASYTYTRTTREAFTPWIGVTAADFLPGAPLTGTLPDGAPFTVQTFVPDAAVIAANGNARILTEFDGFRTTYHGVDVSLVKRMSNRWMGRVAVAWNNPREFYDQAVPVTSFGNPTRTDTNALVQGGQVAPRSAGSGAGDVFINGKWQLNVNAAYQLPADFQVAGNLFGRQGNPFPIFLAGALGRDGSARVLVSPEIDTFRFDDTWNLDLRLAKDFRAAGVRAQVAADLFNVFNSNTELNRQRNLASPNFSVLTQNLSPRILRIGVRLGF